MYAQPVQDVWLTYTAHSPCSPSIPYVSSECMHQIWYTKFTTCTWRMANIKWRIRRVQDVWLTFTAYSPCSRSIPLCIIGNVWSYVCTKFGTPSIRPVPGVWLTYKEVYDCIPIYHRWYIGYSWCTRTIRFVRQPYVLYTSYASLYVCYTPGTGRILRVPNLVHTLDHISPMIHRVYLVYTDYMQCTLAIHHVLVVYFVYQIWCIP